MNKQIPNYLRLVTDTSLQPTVVRNEDTAALECVCDTFAHMTGWQLAYAAGPEPTATSSLMWSAPVNPGVGTSPGHIRLSMPEARAEAEPGLPLEKAGPLAEAIGQMWGEVLATRHALWQREAELAAGVPTIVRDDDPRAPSLGQRLEAVLRGGAQAIGCQAAALYLLDAATTELKLRSSWGLPRRRLAEPARPLPPALADLEALLGHAVVLVEPSLFEKWKVPESGFRSCVCVPVSSPSMPLGTLWLFCDRVREFTDAETNIAEVVAGRLASDLERETLVDEAVLARGQSRQIAAAERLQHEQLPTAAPLVDDWQVAARAYHAESLGGTFYDWFALDDGALAILAGEAHQTGVEGARNRQPASRRRSGVRNGTPPRAPIPGKGGRGSLVRIGRQRLGRPVSGDRGAGRRPRAGAVRRPVRCACWRSGLQDVAALADPSPPLGEEETVRLSSMHHPMRGGELVLAYGTTFLGDAEEDVLAAFDQRLALALEPCLARPASELIDLAGDVLRSYFAPDRTDRVIVLVKRVAR